MKYVVCYSGGHSSALVAIEAVRKIGKENVILLNHDLSPKVEHKDIKRLKREVAAFLGLEITHANMPNKVGNGTALCTYYLKTKPFHKWLAENYPSKPFEPRQDIKLLYGFHKNESHRIQRRVGAMTTQGYLTDYPLATWERTI